MISIIQVYGLMLLMALGRTLLMTILAVIIAMVIGTIFGLIDRKSTRLNSSHL